MKPRITLLTIGVDDLERSLAFYRDGLRLQSPGIVGREFEHGAVDVLGRVRRLLRGSRRPPLGGRIQSIAAPRRLSGCAPLGSQRISQRPGLYDLSPGAC